MAVDPLPGSALRTVPRITSGRTPKWPLTEPGPGTTTAEDPRSTPRTTAAATRPAGTTCWGTIAAQISRHATDAPMTESVDAAGNEAANATPHPSANPAQINDAQRPAREPARRLTVGGAR